jgi:hypothetical protein
MYTYIASQLIYKIYYLNKLNMMKVQIELLIGILKLYFIYKIIMSFGFVYGCLIVYLLTHLRYQFMKHYFGLEKVYGVDQVFFNPRKQQRFNLLAVALVDDFDPEKLKTLIIERGIKKIPKMTKQIVNKFYNLYWKQADVSEAVKNVTVREAPFANQQEFLEYAYSEVNQFTDTIGKFPYSIEIARFDHGRGGIIFKFDHMMSDALGIATMIASLADNYDVNMFPAILKPYTFNLKEYVLDILYDILAVLYIPYVFYQMSGVRAGKTPLKMNHQGEKYDFKVSISNSYNLKDFDHIRKNVLGVTFNNLIVSVISKALSQMCKDKGYTDVKNFVLGMPVGSSYLPERSEDINMTNNVTAILTTVPAVNDVKKESISLHQHLSKLLRDRALVKALTVMVVCMLEILPIQMLSDFNEKSFVDMVDFCCSNVPGPSNPVYLGGSKVTDIIGLGSTGYSSLFIPVVSYNKQFRVSVSTYEPLDFDHLEFMRYVDKELIELRDCNMS